MTQRSATYSMNELHDATGVSARTIRYYITMGLLPAAHGRGPSASYDEGHLARIQLIQLLKSQHLPLDEIRVRLADLSNRQVMTMVQSDAQPIGDRWRRVQLHPDIELHVRENGSTRPEALDEAITWILDLVRPVLDRLQNTPPDQRHGR